MIGLLVCLSDALGHKGNGILLDLQILIVSL